MKSLCKVILIFLAAVALHPCVAKQSEPVVELFSDVTQSFEGFVRDTSAYVMVVDSNVHDSAFKETLVPVENGGFVEYFSRYPYKKETNRNKIFYAYSDSLSPFVKGRSETFSFLDVLTFAYVNRYPMEICPDDIWLMILDGFRLHVKNNHKALKKVFFAPGADSVISVRDKSLTYESTHREWFWTFANLFESLQSKLPSKTGNPLKTRFSTTSPVDYNISLSMGMAEPSHFYPYIDWTTFGIPKIKVNGTKEDWILLKESFNKLALQLNMKWWAKVLNPILDEFIKIFDGKINLEHWKEIYKYYKRDGCCSTRFGGWISRFFPYRDRLIRDGNVRSVKRTNWNESINFDDISQGISVVDVAWHYLDRTIPLKLYTGIVGIQVDNTTKMLKAARGYALMSYGLLNFKEIAKGTKYIPGKTQRLHETLAISDSMNIYGDKGLLYSTHDLEEIELFAGMSYLDREYLDFDLDYDSWESKMKFDFGEPNLSINLYRNGELQDHLFYYAHPQIDGDGAMVSFKGVGYWEKNAAIKKFFKQRKIPINGTVNEFPNEKTLPKFNLEIFIDTVILKEGKKFNKNMDNLRLGIIGTLKKSCGWRIERAIYRHHKYDFNGLIEATISYKDEGGVDSVSMNLKPEISSFQEEIRSILKYAWIPPNVRFVVGSEIAQEIVDKIKVRITLSKDYRMVCKQNGLISKDSVDVISRAWHLSKGKAKSLCNAIDFSKDLATGEIYRYQCEKFDEKDEKLKSSKNIQGFAIFSFDKYSGYDREMSKRTLKDLFVSLKIPPCFVEE